MSRNSEKKIKYCVYCGVEVQENRIYCPNCGKLILKLEPGKKEVQQQSTKIAKPLEIKRKCPGCGSIITSTILDQCPICNSTLEPISEIKKVAIQKKPALIFTDKKLEPEQKFILKRNTWNLKEGINVFGTCIYILVILSFLIFAIISFQPESVIIEMDLPLLLISQIPELLFGIYPLWYIHSKSHSFKKLGFFSGSKKILLAIVIGIVGAFLLLALNFFSNSFISYLADIGLDLFDLEESILEQNQIIKNADLIWILLLILLLCFTSISSELVFRGVLHNALKERFKNDLYVILLISLIYSVIMLLFYFPSFFLLNFLIFAVLGVLYEINGNIYNTIIANICYNIIIIIIIYV